MRPARLAARRLLSLAPPRLDAEMASAGAPRGQAGLNGALAGPCASSGAFLGARPSGVYSTLRTAGGGARLLKFGEHVRRLAVGVNDATFAGGPAGASEGAVRRLLAADLRAFGRAARLADASLRGRELRVTLLLLPAAAAAAAGGAPPAGDDERALAARLDRHVFASPMPRREPGREVLLAVARAPEGREHAHVKDSAWMRRAAELRAEAPDDAEEVVMASPDGRLGEGLSSNFFAVLDGELWTAERGVLHGTVRSLVLEACEDLGVPVRLEPPPLDAAPRFEGALVSSTSRLALPIDRLALGGGRPDVRFDNAPGSVAARVARRVEERVLAESEPVFDEEDT